MDNVSKNTLQSLFDLLTYYIVTSQIFLSQQEVTRPTSDLSLSAGSDQTNKWSFSLVKFYNHLKGSDSQTFHNKAITYREMNLEKSPLSKLVLGLCSQTHPTEPQDRNTIRPNKIMSKQKYNYLTHWKELTKKQSKLECYLALNRVSRLVKVGGIRRREQIMNRGLFSGEQK
jgi:hypothetical protein